MTTKIEIEDPSEEGEDAPVELEPSNSEKGEDCTSSDESGSEEESEGEEDSEDPIVEMEDEVKKWRDLAMRNQADLENYRKRMAREKSEAVQYGNASLLRGLLPILDNFQMGLQAAQAEGEDSIIFQGMKMVGKQIEEFLADEGVESIKSVGSDFDPNQHEAVQQDWSDEAPEGAIIAELRRGYRLRDRLLRAANVVISKGPQPDAEGEEDESGSEG